MQDKVYTQKDLRALNLITTEYEFNMEEDGEFVAVLDLKAETYKKDLRVFFTLEDGRKFIATVHWWQKYLNFYETPCGAKLLLTYTRNQKGGIYLSAAEVIEEI